MQLRGIPRPHLIGSSGHHFQFLVAATPLLIAPPPDQIAVMEKAV